MNCCNCNANCFNSTSQQSLSNLRQDLPSKSRLVPLHSHGGTGQSSRIMTVNVPVSPNPDGTTFFQYNVPRPSIPPGGSHCSDVRVKFLLNGQIILTTEWLGYETRNPVLPLHSDLIILHHVPAGIHSLQLQPEGRVGGCNYGNLFSWDGTLLILED